MSRYGYPPSHRSSSGLLLGVVPPSPLRFRPLSKLRILAVAATKPLTLVFGLLLLLLSRLLASPLRRFLEAAGLAVPVHSSVLPPKGSDVSRSQRVPSLAKLPTMVSMVFLGRQLSQVLRIYAQRVLALVVDVVALREGADVVGVEGSVGVRSNSDPSSFITESDNSVAVRPYGTRPLPAPRRGLCVASPCSLGGQTDQCEYLGISHLGRVS